MKPVPPSEFDRNCADACGAPDVYRNGMIRTVMDKSDWLILGHARADLGRRLLLYRRRRPPRRPADLRVAAPDHRRGGDVGVPARFKGEPLGLPREVWGSILLLALLNNALPFTLFGWGQTHIASGLASILNATTPIWGVIVAHVLTKDERMNPRKIAGVLLGFGGVAAMIGPTLLANIGTDAVAQLACVTASLCYALAAVWARRFRRMGLSPMSRDHRPADRRRGDDAADDRCCSTSRGRSLSRRSCAWGAIIALALFCTAFGYVLYFRLIDYVRRDQRPAGHPAGAAGRDPARRAVPQRDRWPRRTSPASALIALGLAAIDGRLLNRFSGGAGFREQLSRFVAGPVEVADVAPHFAPSRIEQDRRRQHFRARARPTGPFSDRDRRRGPATLSLSRKAIDRRVAGPISWLIATTPSWPSTRCEAASLSSVGSSLTHGAHQVAHRLTSTGTPLKSASANLAAVGIVEQRVGRRLALMAAVDALDRPRFARWLQLDWPAPAPPSEQAASARSDQWKGQKAHGRGR